MVKRMMQQTGSRRKAEDMYGREGKPKLMEDDHRMEGERTFKEKGKMMWDSMALCSKWWQL